MYRRLALTRSRPSRRRQSVGVHLALVIDAPFSSYKRFAPNLKAIFDSKLCILVRANVAENKMT